MTTRTASARRRRWTGVRTRHRRWLGTIDATLIGLLSAFGASGGEALTADIVWRAATLLPQVLTGVLTLLWCRATADRKRRAAADDAGGPRGDPARTAPGRPMSGGARPVSRNVPNSWC